MRTHSKIDPIIIRNFIFGVEDSLVSTVGLLSGIAVAGVSDRTIVLTGIVLIFVEAFSMGIGSFLSEDTIEEAAHRKTALHESSLAGVIMFFSYLIAGLIPLAPYIFNTSADTIWYSIIASLLALLILGLVSAYIFKIPPIKSGVRMVLMGGLAIAAGVIIGQLVPNP